MEEKTPKLNFEELKEIQNSFEDSIKVIERHVAESISNKNEITLIKKIYLMLIISLIKHWITLMN
jgi:NurA-like 5'-3' nuclease